MLTLSLYPQKFGQDYIYVAYSSSNNLSNIQIKYAN